MVRSSDSQYAAAGMDPPGPPFLRGGKERGAPFLRGGKLGATQQEGNYRSSDREFSTGHPGPPF